MSADPPDLVLLEFWQTLYHEGPSVSSADAAEPYLFWSSLEKALKLTSVTLRFPHQKMDFAMEKGFRHYWVAY